MTHYKSKKAVKMKFDKLSDGEQLTRYIVCMEPYKYIEYWNEEPNEIFYWDGKMRTHISSSGISIINNKIIVNNYCDSEYNTQPSDTESDSFDERDLTGSVLHTN